MELAALRHDKQCETKGCRFEGQSWLAVGLEVEANRFGKCLGMFNAPRFADEQRHQGVQIQGLRL